MVQTGGEKKSLAPVNEPYYQQRGAVFFNSSVDHVSRQQCAHSTRHRIWQAKQPASYLSSVQMTDFSVHWQFRIIWRFYFESSWRILSDLSAHLDISHFCSNLFKRNFSFSLKNCKKKECFSWSRITSISLASSYCDSVADISHHKEETVVSWNPRFSLDKALLWKFWKSLSLPSPFLPPLQSCC